MASIQSDFINLIETALSIDNKQRQLAENTFQNFANKQPEIFIQSLINILVSGVADNNNNNNISVNVRQFAAVILRQYMNISHEAKIWYKLSSQTQLQCQNALLDVLAKEKFRPVSSQIAETIGILANNLFSNNIEWTNLLPSLWHMIKTYSNNTNLIINILKIFSLLGEFQMNYLRPCLNDVKGFLQMSLTSSNNNVRSAAIETVFNIILSCEENERELLRDLVPLIFKSLSQSCTDADDDSIRDTLEVLCDWAISLPKFFRGVVEDVTQLMFQIAVANQLEDGTRRMAMNFLLNFIENGKGMVRACKSFAPNVVNVTFQFLLRVEDDDDWINCDNENDFVEMEDLSMGRESVDRLARFMGAKLFLEYSMPIIQEMIKSNDWKQRHAALFAISEMTDGCKKQLKGQLQPFIEMLVNIALNDPMIRVRWASLIALSSIATDFAPEFQEEYHPLIMNPILSLMQPNIPTRLIRGSAMCMIDIITGISKDDTIQYLDQIMQCIMNGLQKDLKTQEMFFALLSATVARINELFLPYYDTFMPYIINVLEQARAIEMREMRGRAMESIGLIGIAVGANKFSQDAERICQILFQDQSVGLSSDDPQYSYMIQALTRICQCMGNAFAPYLDYVIPPLLETAAKEGAVLIDENEKHPLMEQDGFEVQPMNFRGIGKSKYVFSTDILRDKATACNMIYEYAKMLGADYFKYAETTAKIMIPLLEFRFNSDVRIAAMATLPYLIKSINEYCKKNNLPYDMSEQLFTATVEPFIASMYLEMELEGLQGVLHSLREVVEALETSVQQVHIGMIHDVLQSLLQESNLRRQEREHMKTDPDFDEEMAEELEMDNQVEDEFLGYIGDLIVTFAKKCEINYFEPFHQQIHPIISKWLNPNVAVGERCMAVVAYSQVILSCGDAAKQYVQPFLNACLAMKNDSDIDVLQCVYFGLGVCARIGKEQIISSIPDIINILVQVVQHPDARIDEREPATDNAISSLGKLCIVYPDNIVHSQQILPSWLQYLPMKGDEIEAQSVYDDLCHFIENNNVHILGENNSNLPKILEIFAEMLETDTTNEKLTSRAMKIFKNIQQQMDQTTLHNLLSSLSEEQRSKLLRASS